MAEAVASLEGVTKRYGDVVALDAIGVREPQVRKAPSHSRNRA